MAVTTQWRPTGAESQQNRASLYNLCAMPQSVASINRRWTIKHQGRETSSSKQTAPPSLPFDNTRASKHPLRIRLGTYLLH